MLLAGLVVVVGLGLLVPEPRLSFRLQVGIASAVAVADLAVGALAAARYRDSRDLHDLFIAAGFSVLAAQALFGAMWPLFNELYRVDVQQMRNALADLGYVAAPWGPAPVLAWRLGWVVGGVCFVLGVPWWDRRGRPPLRASLVATVGVVAVVGGDLVFAQAYQGNLCTVVERCVRRVDPGAVGAVLALAAVALLVTAAVREVLHRSGGAHRTIGVALAAAIALPIASVRWPTQGMGFVQGPDLIQLAIPAVAFLTLLVAQGSDTSRMRRASDRAAEVMGGRAEIAAMVAHEVRSPVATIKSLAATTSSSYDRLTDAERKEFVGMIEQEASRLLETVNQTSLALKVDAGTLEYTIGPIDLGAAVSDGLQAAQPIGHQLTVDLAPSITVSGDRARLAEAVRQLVANAAKFSPVNSPVSVSSSKDGSHAVVEVVDGGPGIPADRREEVFDRFASWRPPGYEDRTGSGLGLFICRGIVAEHSGEMEIDDAPGGGTILRIRLPLED